jgi:uncharacterized protein YndB with AHSA1/START domain
MYDSADAVLEDRDGGVALRFERELAHPPERVWRALTERAELDAWHPTPFELEPTRGGLVTFQAPAQVPSMRDGEVLEFDPPRALEYTWFEDSLRWELHPRVDGCLLVLTHSFGDRFKAARDGAGWHVCLWWLERHLEAVPSGRDEDDGGVPRGWRVLNEEYLRRFDIPPEKATPPPSAS